MSVPAYTWAWSDFDVANGHHRRYTPAARGRCRRARRLHRGPRDLRVRLRLPDVRRRAAGPPAAPPPRGRPGRHRRPAAAAAARSTTPCCAWPGPTGSCCVAATCPSGRRCSSPRAGRAEQRGIDLTGVTRCAWRSPSELRPRSPAETSGWRRPHLAVVTPCRFAEGACRVPVRRRADRRPRRGRARRPRSGPAPTRGSSPRASRARATPASAAAGRAPGRSTAPPTGIVRSRRWNTRRASEIDVAHGDRVPRGQHLGDHRARRLVAGQVDAAARSSGPRRRRTGSRGWCPSRRTPAAAAPWRRPGTAGRAGPAACPGVWPGPYTLASRPSTTRTPVRCGELRGPAPPSRAWPGRRRPAGAAACARRTAARGDPAYSPPADEARNTTPSSPGSTEPRARPSHAVEDPHLGGQGLLPGRHDAGPGAPGQRPTTSAPGVREALGRRRPGSSRRRPRPPTAPHWSAPRDPPTTARSSRASRPGRPRRRPTSAAGRH